MNATSDGLDQEDHNSKTVIAVTAVCVALSTTVITLRLFTRVYLTHQAGKDDFMALLSWIFVTLTGIMTILLVNLGLGRLVLPPRRPIFNIYFYIFLIFYKTSLIFIKSTILLQYHRLSHLIHRYQLLILLLSLPILGWNVFVLAITVIACIPIRATWDHSPRVSGARCIDPALAAKLAVVGNMTTDMVILIMPLPVLGRLELPRHRKVGLVMVSSLGIVTTVLSAVRLPFLGRGPDPGHTNVVGESLTMAEITSGLICACLPTLPPFLARYCPCLRYGRTMQRSDDEIVQAVNGVLTGQEEREVGGLKKLRRIFSGSSGRRSEQRMELEPITMNTEPPAYLELGDMGGVGFADARYVGNERDAEAIGRIRESLHDAITDPTMTPEIPARNPRRATRIEQDPF